MYLIVGLGNPEKKYMNTRHNVGFDGADALAEKLSVNISKMECKALTGSGFYEGQKIMLAKPVTYMNLSGESIRALVDYYNIDPASELLVIYDDVSLETGKLRIRKMGSAGGHNGIKSIIQHLGSDEFWRIKIGVGAAGPGKLVSHVLGHFDKKDREIIDESLVEACDAALMMALGNNDEAMNRYNRKKEKPGADKEPSGDAQKPEGL